MSDKVSIFVNGDNLYAFQKTGFWIDPNALQNWISQEFGGIAESYYYMSVDEQNEKQMNFVKVLSHFGYITRAKPARKHELEPIDNGYLNEDEIEYEFEKANLDMEIVCDLLITKPIYNRAVIVCPSRDFLRPIELVKNSGKIITVIGSRNFISHNILNVVGRNFVELNNIKSDIIRKDAERRIS